MKALEQSKQTTALALSFLVNRVLDEVVLPSVTWERRLSRSHQVTHCDTGRRSSPFPLAASNIGDGCFGW